MDEDYFPAAERILSDIEAIFKKDPKLKEFEILPVTVNENKSPVHHINHSLGLESWCVPHVYCYAYNHLMDIRQQRKKREDMGRVNKLLLGVLLLNPDVTVFWNMRREMVQRSNLDPHSELHFTSVVLSRKPKSAEVFIYRKWLLKILFASFPFVSELLSSELEVCEMAAELYPNNYHAWNHRIWCLTQSPTQPGTSLMIHINEWHKSHKWITTHVSDHSGFQYRQHLLVILIKIIADNDSLVTKSVPDLLDVLNFYLQLFFSPSDVSPQTNNGHDITKFTKKIISESFVECKYEHLDSVILALIISELILNTDLIVTFPGHEAIWSHRRFILYTLQKYLSDVRNQGEKKTLHTHKDCDGIPVEKDQKMESASEGLERRLMRFEECLYDRCKCDKNRQVNYAEKHRTWLSSVLKLQLSFNKR